MKETSTGMDRRKFLRTGVQAAAGAALLSGVTAQAAPKNKKIALNGKLPEVEFGKTGHKLPVLGHGGSAMAERFIGDYGLKINSREERLEMVRRGYDQGIRYFDTARVYGESEGIMGEALADVRDNVYLATKVAVMQPGQVRASVEKSLEDLRTDYVDCMQVHGPVWEYVKYEGAMKIYEELDKMRSEGMIRFIGLTGHTQFVEMYKGIQTGSFDQLLIQCGYMDKGMNTRHSQKNIEYREMCLSAASERDMGIVAMKVYGAMAFGHNAKNLVSSYDADKLAKLPGACVRHTLNDPRVDILNIGMSMPSDIDANVEILKSNLELTADDRMLLAEFTEQAWNSDAIQAFPVA